VEINITKKGDLQILSVKGKIHLQSWRVLDKHLESLLQKGCRWVALDLGEVSLICSTGVGAIMHNVRKFQDNECTLMLVSSSPYVQDLLQIYGCEAVMGDNIFLDWRALEKRLQSQGLALSE
jgi:anti-anti-sigma factor